MKVLITGGYGFIGSHVADKFYREGHEIFIIDNLITGDKKNVIHKHRFYQLSTVDKRCEEVFKSNRFDLVIYLSGRLDEDFAQRHPYSDAETSVLGLINILSLSSTYGVKKFIYASSAYVYGDVTTNPVQETAIKMPNRIMGMNHETGEYYCQKWQEIYGIDTVSLRLAFVYGPRQNRSAQANVIGDFLDCIEKQKAALVYGDGNQAYDFIFIDDLVTAIYKLAVIKYSGVLNLGSGTSTSIKELILEMEKYEPFKSVTYLESRRDELGSIQLDVSQVERVLDWIPQTTLEEGLGITFDWIRKSKEKDSTAEKTASGHANKKKKRVLSHILEMMEDTPKILTTIELILVFVLVTFIYVQNALNYKELPIDLYLFGIILFSALYGSRFGIYSFSLSAISNVVVLMLTNRDPLVLIYSADFYFQMAYYVFIAFIIGYVRDKMSRDIRERDADLVLINDRMEFLNDLYRDMRNVRDELQNQITNSEDSFGKIFAIVQELNTLKPEEVFGRAVLVVEKLMKTKSVAIYKFTETSYFARVMAFSYEMNDSIKKSIRIEDSPELKEAIEKRDVIVNRTLEEGRPLLVMPVLDGDKVLGGIMLYGSDFSNLTLAYQNYFKVITGLISTTLSRAYSYDEAIEDDKYIENTCIMKPNYFQAEYQSKSDLKRNLKLEFIEMEIQLQGQGIGEVSDKIDSIIRDTDCIGQKSDTELVLLLGNTNVKEAAYVLDRLEKLGIRASIIERVEEND